MDYRNIHTHRASGSPHVMTGDILLSLFILVLVGYAIKLLLKGPK